MEYKLSTEPYKGMRDFYPQDMVIQNYITQTMARIVEQFGYEAYSAPVLEETNLYRAKSGQEIVNEQTYSFTDRGGRDVTMRPEMTPTVARLVARKRKELSFPLRWYSIPALYRYERPQRGRLREHYQLNVDMFGVDSILADREILQISYQIMNAFGAQDKNFEICVNDRRIISYLLQNILKLDVDTAYKVSKLIDRKNKMSKDQFQDQALELIPTNSNLFFAVLEVKLLEELPTELRQLEATHDLAVLLESLKKMGITNVIFDPTLMRGFDYYTKLVFEVFDKNPLNNRSLFGGGRYDDLVGLFGVEKVPGIGFGMGDVTIRDFIETYNLFPTTLSSSTDVYICGLGEEYTELAQECAQFLRSAGCNIAIDLTNRKLAAQSKTAEKQNIPFVLSIGENMRSTQTYTLKNLRTKQQFLLPLNQISAIIKSTL